VSEEMDGTVIPAWCERAAREVFDDMRDRSGMDFDLDDDTKNEILATWACIIYRRAPSEAVGLLRALLRALDVMATHGPNVAQEEREQARRFLAAQEKA